MGKHSRCESWKCLACNGRGLIAHEKIIDKSGFVFPHVIKELTFEKCQACEGTGFRKGVECEKTYSPNGNKHNGEQERKNVGTV